MAQSEDGGQTQLARYVNELLIRMHQSQRELIQARYVDQGDQYQHRVSLQSDIISLYWTLKPYEDRAPAAWKKMTLYQTSNGEVTGLDDIATWNQLEQEVTQSKGELSTETETETEPQVLPKQALIPAATAVAKVADKIGFNAQTDNRVPEYGFEEVADNNE